MSKSRKTLGEFLTERRLSAGVTQAEVGKVLDLGQSAIARIEGDHRDVSFLEACMLSELLGFELNEAKFVILRK